MEHEQPDFVGPGWYISFFASIFCLLLFFLLLVLLLLSLLLFFFLPLPLLPVFLPSSVFYLPCILCKFLALQPSPATDEAPACA